MLLGVALWHVVAVAPAILLGRVPRREGQAIVAEHDALEQIGNLGPRCVARTRPFVSRIAWTLSHSSRLIMGGCSAWYHWSLCRNSPR